MTTPRPELRVLPGSERPALAIETPLRAAPPQDGVALTLVVRRREPLPADVAVGARLDPEVLAADPADAERVTEVLTRLGLTVDEVHLPSRRVSVSGTVGVAQEAFGTRLLVGTGAAGEELRLRSGVLHVPAELDGIVVAVLGLDDRPQARARIRPLAGAPSVSYLPWQLGEVYGFPPGTDGRGQTLAIIELGGGFDLADLTTYFRGAGRPVPRVRAVGVDGATNQPGADPQGADGEVLLDLEVAGGLAPGAELVAYFAPNTDRGFLDAVATAVHATPTPTAVSISWGQSEDAWTAQARAALDGAMADAAALGVTVAVAAGDSGSSDTPGSARGVHVDFPASSPHALACGGTRLDADPATGAVRSETVWDDPGHGATGGGVSDTFPLPAWQGSVGVPARAGSRRRTITGRGVPDVAAVADPATGYAVRVDGRDVVVGGTSAVAPLWAALVCRLAQSLGRRLGLLQPQLYAGVNAGAVAPGFRDITIGSNGAYAAGPGWDACTGLGVPVGTALLARLQAPTPPPRPS